MQTLRIVETSGRSPTLDDFSFDRQKALADAVAGAVLATPMLLSWYDASRGIESPNGVSECGHAAPSDGVRLYAASRGGVLAVELLPRSDDPAVHSLFCYLELGVAQAL